MGQGEHGFIYRAETAALLCQQRQSQGDHHAHRDADRRELDGRPDSALEIRLLQNLDIVPQPDKFHARPLVVDQEKTLDHRFEKAVILEYDRQQQRRQQPQIRLDRFPCL